MRRTRKTQIVETRRDRRALAKDAGMGRISALSVLAGALCGLAAFEALVVIGGAVLVGIHRSTNFGTWSTKSVQDVTVAVVAVAAALGFLFGGYIGGRTSRRSGATHGVLVGILGGILATAAVVVVTVTNADQGLAAVARHIQVVSTGQQWHSAGVVAAVVAAAAMLVFGFAGGLTGEHWHTKLAHRAIDPAFGPQVRRHSEARQDVSDADLARLSASSPDTTEQMATHATPASDRDVEKEREGDLVSH